MKKNFFICSIAAFLCFVLCFAEVSALAASSSEEHQFFESKAYQDGYLEKEEPAALYSESGDEAGAKGRIIAALRNLVTVVNISDYEIPRENMNRIINEIIDENPEFYYLNINKVSYTSYQGIVYNLDFTEGYRFSTSEIQEKNERIAAEVSRILAKVDRTNMNQAEQALAVHDYFVLHYEYDIAAADAAEIVPREESVAKAFRIDGLFLDRTAVCQGYALGYMYILKKLNIPAILVPSSAMNHAWNMVKIGSNWYHVDVTWDDPVPDMFGHVGHSNFLRGDEEFYMETEHYGWTILEEAAADYPGMFWENITSEMVYHDGKWYYRNGTKIAGRAFADTETTVKTITEHWPVPGVPGAYYTTPIFTIGLWNDCIYYNTPTTIKKINVDGTDDVVVLEPELDDNYIYGVIVEGNLIRYRTAPDIYEEGQIHTEELYFSAVLESDKVKIINMGSISVGNCFYVAVYQGKELLSLRVCPVVAGQTEYQVTPEHLAKGEKVRVFAWEDLRSAGAFEEIHIEA